MKVKRSLRVSQLLKKEIGEIITLKVRDPYVKSIMISYVKVSDDLKIANIYYRLFGAIKNKTKTAEAIERVKKYIRLEVGHRTELRYVPELKFFYDTGVDEANKIDSLLEKIKKNDSE